MSTSRCAAIVYALAALFYGAGAIAAPAKPSTAQTFHALLAAQWEHYLENNPEAASLLGDRRFNDRWTDASLAHVKSEHTMAVGFLERFKAINRARLSAGDRLNDDLIIRQLKTELKSFDLKLYEMPIYQWRSSTPLRLASLVGDFPFDTVKDYDDYIVRLKRLPVVLDRTVDVAKLGQRDRLMPPKYLLEKLAARLDSLEAPAGAENAFAQPLTRFPASVGEADRARIRADVVAAIDGVVRPAYRRFNVFLKYDFAPNGRSEPGLWSLPNGNALYRYAVEKQTTTTQAPEDIHRVGLAEVARIEGEMTAIAAGLGYDDLKSFREALRDDPRLHASSRKDVLDRYRRFIDGMQTKLPQLFGILPKTRLVVEPVETYRESAAPLAEYHQGSPDGSQPGRVYVNTGAFETRSTLPIEAAAYHEGVPGHHLQFSIAQTLPGLPTFRQQADYNAYVEGWGLYAEQLGKDVGFYQDPLSDYGRLSSELLRADRLVLDTGVHYKHWTRQQMLDFFHAHSSEDEASIVSEVDRYISIPAQALAYKVGELKILRLRERAKAALGDRFDIKAFHDQIIGAGALPLDVLETRIDAWIATVRRGSSPSH